MDSSPKSNHHNNQPSQQHNKPTNHHQPSTSELLSSAKLVAEAAKSSLHHDSDKVDKAKVAGAAADLLGAAHNYGKLEEKGYGKYIEKAENYLHSYHSSHLTTATATVSGDHEITAGQTNSASSHDGKSGSGYGHYLKMAEGLLKKKH